MSEKSDLAKKRINQNKFVRSQQNKKAKMFVPNLVDDRLIYVRDHFIGVENYSTVRTVDKDGVI